MRGVSLQCLIQMVANCDGRALYIYERCGVDLDVVDSTVSTWGVENEFSEIVSRTKYKGRLKNILPVLHDVDKSLQLKRMGAKERGFGVAESRRKRYELTENAARKRASWSDGRLGLSVRVGAKWAGAVLKKASRAVKKHISVRDFHKDRKQA